MFVRVLVLAHLTRVVSPAGQMVIKWSLVFVYIIVYYTHIFISTSVLRFVSR